MLDMQFNKLKLHVHELNLLMMHVFSMGQVFSMSELPGWGLVILVILTRLPRLALLTTGCSGM
jgi:hypothetical protein